MNDKNKLLVSGKVISICSTEIWVEIKKEIYACVIRGSLKKNRLNTTNLVVVGDNVKILVTGAYVGVIEEIEPRQNFLSRNISRNRYHIMVANIDLVLIMVTLNNFSQNLIDRYIVMSLKQNILPIIIVNKWDLSFSMEERKKIELAINYYKSLDMKIFIISCKTNLGIVELAKFTKGKTSMFLGQSGVGKTSLFNKLTGKDYKTQEINQRTKKGIHTTTRSVLVFSKDAWYIDSPGIKSFGLHSVTSAELQEFFIEIKEKANFCKYTSCLHMHEPDCAVKLAVQEGLILKQRLESYYILLEEMKLTPKRRERVFISRKKKKD